MAGPALKLLASQAVTPTETERTPIFSLRHLNLNNFDGQMCPHYSAPTYQGNGRHGKLWNADAAHKPLLIAEIESRGIAVPLKERNDVCHRSDEDN